MPNDKADTAKAMRDAIAARVRGALSEANKTQRQVAELLGIPQSAVSLRLTGDRAFRAEELAALSDYLDVPVERFMPAQAEAGAA